MTQPASLSSSTRTKADLPPDSYVSFTGGSKLGLEREGAGIGKHQLGFLPVPPKKTGILSSLGKLNSNKRTGKILQLSRPQAKRSFVLCGGGGGGEGWIIEAETP